jgi:hypothetical protein
MKSIMKRSFAMAVGGALLALSASATAGDAAAKSSAVKLSDADLDQITAGSGAFSAVAISNPGKHSVNELHGRPGEFPSHSTCINCVSEGVSRASGLVGVALPNGGIIIIELGRGRIF